MLTDGLLRRELQSNIISRGSLSIRTNFKGNRMLGAKRQNSAFFFRAAGFTWTSGYFGNTGVQSQGTREKRKSIFSFFISPLYSVYICQGNACTFSAAVIRPSQGLTSLLKLNMNKCIIIIQTRFSEWAQTIEFYKNEERQKVEIILPFKLIRLFGKKIQLIITEREPVSPEDGVLISKKLITHDMMK